MELLSAKSSASSGTVPDSSETAPGQLRSSSGRVRGCADSPLNTLPLVWLARGSGRRGCGEWDACGVVSAATHVGEQAVLHRYGCSGDGIALALAPPAGKRLRESLPSPTHTIFHLASRTVSYTVHGILE